MKTQLFGSALVITSSIKLEDIKTVKKYNEKALTLYEKDEDGDKQPVFTALYKKDCDGTITENGAVFSKESPDGFAQITELVNIPKDTDPEDWIADNYGKALIGLAKYEEYFPAIIDELNATREKVKAGIEVVG